MADREVLSIDIDDSAFSAFKKKFSEYQKAVADMPSKWGAVNDETGKSRPILEKLNELIDAQSELIGKTGEHIENSARPMQNVAESWGVIYRSGKLWGAHIKSSTLSLARWTGLTAVFSSILSAGGLYGIDRMAMGVSGRRTSALGYGTTIGAQSSFLTNFGRLGNAEGILSATSKALSDPRSRVFRALGVGGKIQGMDAPHAFAAILPDIERLLKAAPENQLAPIIQGYGLGELGIGINEARVIRRMSHGEISSMQRQFASNEPSLNTGNSRAWADFTTQMELAGATIRTAFERNLVSLNEPMMHITKSFETLFLAMLEKGGVIDDLIKDVGVEIEKVAKELGSDKVLQTVNSFVDHFDVTTKQFNRFNDWLGQHGDELKIGFAAFAGYLIGGIPGAAAGAAAAVGSMWNGPDTPEGRRRAHDSVKSTFERMRHLSDDRPLAYGQGIRLHEKAQGPSMPAGWTAPGLHELEEDTADIPGGRRRISAENDEFHHRVNPNSAHTKGLAFDQSLLDPSKSGKAAEYERRRLRAAGLMDADFTIIDEYKHPSPHSTGGHIHTQFNSREAAEKYREYSIKNHPNNTVKQTVPSVEVVDKTGGGAQVSVGR